MLTSTALNLQFNLVPLGDTYVLLSIQGNNNHLASSFGKLGVPSPVTGSHPSTAEKPSVPHPGFEPLVMSLNASRNLAE